MTDKIAAAQRLIDKHGFGPITIDEFDIFIIDERLAQDPGTTDTNDLAYKGFVIERAAARKAINTAAAKLPAADDLFQVGIEEAGQTYVVEPYGENKKTTAYELNGRVKTFTENKAKGLKRDMAELTRLIELHGEDERLTDAKAQVGIVSAATQEALPKILGIIAQLERGYLIANGTIKSIKEEYEEHEE